MIARFVKWSFLPIVLQDIRVSWVAAAGTCDLVGSLISTQNLQRGLSKTPQFLNGSLALGQECPQNKKIFKEIIKESYHSKIEQKKLA